MIKLVNQKTILEGVKRLNKEYPHAKYYLNWSNPLELLVAAMLSPQVRDEVVNACTPKLFAKYKTAKDYAEADLKEFIEIIKPISFPAMKAARIQKACKILVEKYGGKVPDTMEELIKIPGIGRKTAGTILINAFDKVENIPCDTHAIRVSFRLGWTRGKTGDEVEKDLMKLIPKEYWKKLPYQLKAHGRAICKAPIPYCSKCFLNDICPKNGVTKKY
ncbi:MAG: endonuclease III [Candidatus Aenigmatarchaeota archaeon]|nr:endonuclease III [Candidatus Aenigmarchaeota archaeon]